MEQPIRLPFVLEHIVEIRQGSLCILDRRAFPFRKAWVACKNESEIANALRSMVTQGGGPLECAIASLEFLAPSSLDTKTLRERMAVITSARKTNTTMRDAVDEILNKLEGDALWREHLPSYCESMKARFLDAYRAMGRIGAQLLPDDAKVLTTCFPEHSFLFCLQEARAMGKHVTVLSNETRPYLQGSRLTAPSLEELGFDVSVITDGMGAHYMREGAINCYLTAVDALLSDGAIINKTGTLANAIAAKAFGIPYIAFALSPTRPAGKVVMEERDGAEVTHCRGRWTTTRTMKALYPAFDLVPKEYVTHVVTPQGLFKEEQR